MANTYTNLRSWFLTNVDTGETLQGQFHPLGLTKNVGSDWSSHTTLGRKNSIIQFLKGRDRTISFQARLYAIHSEHDITVDLETLETWAEADASFGNRPPILTLKVGDGHLVMDCVCEGLDNIQYGEPTASGGLREINLTIKLRQYAPYDLNETTVTDTRYHRARERDYYELLCEKEYGDPLLGDVIRKRHPSKINLAVGDIVKMPAIEGVRKEKVTQESIPFKTSTGRKDTDQRALRQYMFDQRNRPYVSHVVVA